MEAKKKEFEKLESISESYYELIMTVENKYPNENRHQTALRLIREAQNHEKAQIEYEEKELISKQADEIEYLRKQRIDYIRSFQKISDVSFAMINKNR